MNLRYLINAMTDPAYRTDPVEAEVEEAEAIESHFRRLGREFEITEMEVAA